MATEPVIHVEGTYCTPSILDLTSTSDAALMEAVSACHRMLAGDWGEVDDEDKASNDRSLRNGSRMIGAYRVAGERVWVIVEAGAPMTDTMPAMRPMLTIMKPEDY